MPQISEDQIRERAYYIWQQTGCPTGSELENWLRAEAELRLTGKAKQPAKKASTQRKPVTRA